MNKTFIFIGLALLVSFALAQTAPCPLQSQIGSLISARVIVAKQQSLVALVEGTDVQCYNYSLPYSFSTVPDVAVAVHDFESRATNDLFFSIKPIQTESLAFVPFLIRTQWKYTAWTKIGFSFLAEDRTDLEAGYYQVDSGMLGGCEPGKSIQVLLPFRQIGLQPGNINHNLFLHGFEISVQRYNATTLSPFEIQLVDSSTNSSGIAVLISVTTVTQVQAIHISYLAWAATTLQAVVGSYVYDLNPSFEIVHTPVSNIGRNYARLHGLTGFIINYSTASISFTTTWTGSKFVFDFSASQKFVQYFSFQYIFFIGSECSDCPGYIYTYNGRCVAFCPAGSYPTSEKTCIQCGDGYFWDGTQCRKLCPDGQYLNIATNECECTAGLFWTGKVCLSCTGGKQFNNVTKTCECPVGTRWNGFSCAKQEQCQNGREWDVFTFTCKCPIGTTWNGTFCFKPPICRGGQYLNENYVCVCPPNTYFRDQVCQNTGCTGGQIWNGVACACDPGYNWNGSVCLLCINGQKWDQRTSSCVCQEGTQWNGNFCQKFISCGGGRVYNKDYDQCLCPDKNYWNGYQCVPKPECCCGQKWNQKTFICDCPQGFNWDGRSCVVCTSGKTFDSISKTCICPPGTQWNNQFCTVIENCRGGMIWNQNTWACQCPSIAVWNGNYCINNPCTDGKVWDNFSRSCICVNNFQLIGGKCVAPEIACTNGTIFNPVSLTCVCPVGKWFNPVTKTCDTIPTCISNQVYSEINNRCICQPGLVWLSSKNACGDPTCPVGKRWNGIGCVDISCPPNSYFNGTECICPNPADYCLPWEIFNGVQCVYSKDSCPKGTRWDSSALSCVSTGECPDGFYRSGVECKPLPQRCLPPTVWNNGKCSAGRNCPFGTYLSGNNCQPRNQCGDGQIWNTDLLQCVCPENTGWNGNQCVTCGGGQIWNLYEGCQCPQGQFFQGDKCETVDRTRCNLIPNANWNPSTNMCLCDPGFSIVGKTCICKGGVPFEHFCDRCAHRPHSQWRFGICQCDSGYTLYGTECLPNQDGNDRATDCSVGTFFDSQQKKCLACPTGCLSCIDSYTCQVCSFEYRFDPASSLCLENCGDGIRFFEECDDDNNDPADGCSVDCKIELGWNCRGGTPTTRDYCQPFTPAAVTLIQTGQIRYSTKIVLNVKMDYLPLQLLQSNECKNGCESILVAQLTGGEKSARIKSTYLSGSRYAFTIQMNFDRPYIAKFDVEISVNPALSRYFTGVNINNKLNVSVNPAFLATVDHQIPDVLK